MNRTAAPKEIMSAIGPEYKAMVTPDSLGRINVKGTLKIKSLNKDSIMDSAGLPID